MTVNHVANFYLFAQGWLGLRLALAVPFRTFSAAERKWIKVSSTKTADPTSILNACIRESESWTSGVDLGFQVKGSNIWHVYF